MVYSSKVDDKVFTFGVSGRLYKSNVLIYDHQTESLWSQLKETAISGPMVGRKLKKISAERTAWKHWLKKHPQTKVLSTDTGYHRDYNIDPYEGYYRALGIMFPVGDVRTDLPAKEMVLGVEINGAAKAYPLSLLERKTGMFKDEIGENRGPDHLIQRRTSRECAGSSGPHDPRHLRLLVCLAGVSPGY